ncbi:putative membrane protein YesL [Gracilibacillus halotolerans]|uniref:Putative membrane protein YesL n=1 Tax=Gracilibacillus halotolerans TaxID=74386 RepID=A0A841RPH6_9BACI|nr:YesL family protein [Gracilibacillus halotolerans]MBB6512558.1 putative membrane protein YesL [Gracilibacillus halotolerans]
MKGLFAVTEWITRFAYVNLLWIAFTILGLGVFGLFPATVAMFAIIRKWLRGDVDLPVFKTFWELFKKDFWKANGIGLIFAVISYLFWINLQFMQLNDSTFAQWAKIPLYFGMLVIALTLLYVIPAFVHYEAKMKDIWKNAFLVMLIHPFHNVLMILGIVVSTYIMFSLSGLLFFFGASFLGFIIMGTCYHAFMKIAEKQEALKKKEEEQTN